LSIGKSHSVATLKIVVAMVSMHGQNIHSGNLFHIGIYGMSVFFHASGQV